MKAWKIWKKLRQDSTVIETNIHYPTNNALVWDCVKESHRLFEYLQKEITDLNYRDYTKTAKKTFYKINNTKSAEKRIDLFKQQLITFTKCINQVSNVIKKKNSCSMEAYFILVQLEKHLPAMQQVYEMTEKREIKNEVVANNEKLFFNLRTTYRYYCKRQSPGTVRSQNKFVNGKKQSDIEL